MREQTRNALAGLAAPEGLWERTMHRLDDIDAARLMEHETVAHPRPMKWRQAWPFAAAAAALLVLGGVVGLPETDTYRGASMGALQDVVSLHATGLPADVPSNEPQQVAQYFQGKTPFPVRPAEFGGQPMRLTGARYVRVGDKPAAALYYTHGDRRVTLLVFQDSTLVDTAQRTRVGGRELYYYNVGRQVVTIRRHNGLNYAFFGDLERPKLFQVAASAHVTD